jgi:hypothetical protein
MVVLGGGVFGCLIAGTHFFQLYGCIESIVSVSLPEELLSVLQIEPFGFPLALTVGTIRAGMQGAFIGVEATPGETVENILFRSGDIAALVGVFDTKNKVALVLTGKKIVIQYCPYPSEVKATGGAWREPEPDFLTHRAQR